MSALLQPNYTEHSIIQYQSNFYRLLSKLIKSFLIKKMKCYVKKWRRIWLTLIL